MPSKLDRDDILEILREYHATGSKSGTADNLDYSRSTVRKYVKENYEDWCDTNDKTPVDKQDGGGDQTDAGQDDDGHVTDALANGENADGDTSPAPGPAPGGSADAPRSDEPDSPEGFTATPPSQSPVYNETALTDQQSHRDDVDFAKMSCGDFIEWFFSQPTQGVSEDFAANFAELCRARGQIPDKEMMAERIYDGASGIGKKGDAEMIADTYWVRAQDFLQAQGVPQYAQDKRGGWQDTTHQGQPQQPGQGQQSPQPNAPDGDWLRPDDTTQNQGFQGQQDSWSGNWDDSSGQGRQPQQGQQYTQQPQYNQQQPNQQWGGQNTNRVMQSTGDDQRVDKLAEVMQGVQQTQQRILEHLNSDGETENQTLKQQMREFRQAKEELEAIAGDDDNDEYDRYIQQIQRQMQELEQQMHTQQESAGNSAGDMQWMVQLMQQDDVDPDTVTSVAEAMGQTTADPEVRKKELELEHEEQKAHRRRETINAIFDNVGEAMGSGMGKMVQAALSDDGDDEQAQQEPQQGQQQAGGGMAAGNPAGEEMMSGPAKRFEEIADETPGADTPSQPNRPQPQAQNRPQGQPQPQPPGQPPAENQPHSRPPGSSNLDANGTPDVSSGPDTAEPAEEGDDVIEPADGDGDDGSQGDE